MFSLEERKNNTKNIIEYVKKKLLNITNNRYINGYILVLFHWLLTGIPLVYLFIGEINILFYISCFIWIIVFILHFYFHGCIFSRIERDLWQEKKWWGPWIFLFTPLENIGIDMTTALANNIFICWGSSIVLLVFLRLLFK